MRGRSIDFYPFFSNHKTLSTQRPAIKNHFSSAVHTIASQLSIFPRGHESMAKKKKVANKATHQQAEMWEPGVFGPGPLCHADNLLPIFCQFFFCFFLVRCELLRWFAFNYAAIEKLLRVQQFRFQFIFSHLELGGVKGWVLGRQTTGFKFVTATTNMTNAKWSANLITQFYWINRHNLKCG